MTWRDRAACAGRWPELDYFSTEPTMVAACKQVCSTCPVLEPCRQWANDNAEMGVWGGQGEDKRQVALRRVYRLSQPATAQHGTRSRYRKGCKCSECFEAERTYRMQYRSTHKPSTGVHEQVTEVPALSTFVTQGE